MKGIPSNGVFCFGSADEGASFFDSAICVDKFICLVSTNN